MKHVLGFEFNLDNFIGKAFATSALFVTIFSVLLCSVVIFIAFFGIEIDGIQSKVEPSFLLWSMFITYSIFWILLLYTIIFTKFTKKQKEIMEEK